MYWPWEGIEIPWYGRAVLNMEKCSAQPGGPGSCAEYGTQ